MARSLQLKTVAEGVETQGQIALLKELGCDVIQGFVVSVPMDETIAREWLESNGSG